jgi:hypothetical protein
MVADYLVTDAFYWPILNYLKTVSEEPGKMLNLILLLVN